MTAPRSYSDPEIARYVLGLDMPDHGQGIQALLAHDDAAAARALKWEAYLLNIVDALPMVAPPDTLMPRIQQTLGMTFEAAEPSASVLGETRERPASKQARGAHASWTTWLRQVPIPLPEGLKRPSRKVLAWSAAAGIVIVALIVILVLANLHTPLKTTVQQVVPVQTK
ncbi:hypothetical protein CDEF62S_01070 [Castellaniella defragrans]